ncbi:hypothetical protein DXT89_18660 [Agrobacterium vitis]|uniref:Lipopolysaccharide core biosynthesis protein n=1 Tax=Agrobacterium vitis TaxID=373 RepID=A0A368NI20_AGRVI|nr:hypothetical protein DXM22_16870 [Agrobacterium vitis]KAA3525347.1 hypothetical protein DXT89_18660 [Agrobacterium vitis]RCU50237.1 hypothetical protein ASB66_022905 [Agrobacterium vitis]
MKSVSGENHGVRSEETSLAQEPNVTSTPVAQQRQQVACIGFWADYEDYFWTKADPSRFDVHVLNVKDAARHRPIFKIMPRFGRKYLYNRIIAQQIASQPDALFLVNEREEIVEYLHKARPRARIAVVVRNPIATKNGMGPLLQDLHAAGYPVLSFDEADCQRYGFEPYRQYIAAVDSVKSVQAVVDFAFLGKDKGRKSLIEALSSDLRRRGFTTSIRFTELKKARKTLADRLAKHTGNSPYPAYLAENLAARCIIDIVQDGQQGLTLRPLEATLYGRKLLTNNGSVRVADFYHPANVFLLDGNANLDGIEEFFKAPFQPVSPEVMALYSVEALIDRVNILLNNVGVREESSPAA